MRPRRGRPPARALGERPSTRRSCLTCRSASIVSGASRQSPLDLSSLGAKLGRPLHAILGQSFFEGRVVQFDYGQQLLKLDPTIVEEGLSVPIEGAADLTPVVTVTVNGREVPVVLDTGSSLTLGIYLDAVDDLGLATARDAATRRTVTGARGKVEAYEGMVDSLALGDVRLERVPTVFLPRADRRPDARSRESRERLPPTHDPHARLPARVPEHPRCGVRDEQQRLLQRCAHLLDRLALGGLAALGRLGYRPCHVDDELSVRVQLVRSLRRECRLRVLQRLQRFLLHLVG